MRSKEDIDAVKDLGSERLTEEEKAALRWAERVTDRKYFGAEADEDFTKLRDHFSDDKIAMITGVAAFYNFVNRFIDALQVEVGASLTQFEITKADKTAVE